MGQRELLLTLGAIAIFSISSLSINQLIVKNSDMVYGQQAALLAANVAQRFIEEAKVKAFDETTIIGTPLNLPEDFKWNLGPDSGESYPDFDDVDDYHGFETTVDSNVGPMQVGPISVFYVEETDLDTAASDETFYKKMVVTVNSAYLNHAVTAEYVFAFQKNR